MRRKPRTRISGRLREAIQAARRLNPQWMLSRKAGVHPVTLSGWMTGARDVEVDDRRAIAVGALLGLRPCDCFERKAAPGQLPDGGVAE